MVYKHKDPGPRQEGFQKSNGLKDLRIHRTQIQGIQDFYSIELELLRSWTTTFVVGDLDPCFKPVWSARHMLKYFILGTVGGTLSKGPWLFYSGFIATTWVYRGYTRTIYGLYKVLG